MKSRIFLFLSLVTLFGASAFAQGAKNIKINEVLTNNTESMLDEYGNRLPWLELENSSFSTFDIRGMYITTDKSVLDKNLSVPERIKRMSQITNGSEETTLSGQEHIVFFLNSSAAKGDMHLGVRVNAGSPVWIALYDGNAVDLIDSISVPALKENCSYARCKAKDKTVFWQIKTPETVSAGTANITTPTETKIAKLKRDDPHGFGITILAMGVVFSCLALLYISFFILGKIMTRTDNVHDIVNLDKKEHIKLDISRSKLPDEPSEKEAIPDEIAAVIALAIKDYQDDVHVEEAGVITLIPTASHWTGTNTL